MATISRLSVSLTANTKGLRVGLQKASATVKRFTSKIFSLKGALVGALGIGSLGALSASSVRAFGVQEQAVASLDASINSMGRTTKNLSSDLQTLASQIQQEGILGDEAILQGASFLTTYGKITDALLPRTIRIMADLAAKTGGSTTRAANLLGKASMGLTGALSIAGISLSDATKKSKDFGAILSEIEEQIGGANKALGDTSTGALTQFSNAMGDLKEVLGGVIMVAIGPFLRLFAQNVGKLKFNIEATGEAFKDWIIEVAKSMAGLRDIGLALGILWDGVKGVFMGFVSAVTAGLHAIGTGLNALFTAFGAEPIIKQDHLDFLESKMFSIADRAKDLQSTFASDAFDLATGETALPSVKLKAEIDELAIAAGVAEMKQRLGLTGGPNIRQGPPARVGFLEKLNKWAPSQTKAVEEQTDVLKDIRGALNVSRGAIAG